MNSHDTESGSYIAIWDGRAPCSLFSMYRCDHMCHASRERRGYQAWHNSTTWARFNDVHMVKLFQAWHRRCSLKAWHTQSHPHTLNRDRGALPSQYNSLITRRVSWLFIWIAITRLVDQFAWFVLCLSVSSLSHYQPIYHPPILTT